MVDGGHIRHVYGTEVKPFNFHDGTYDPVEIRETA